MTISVTAAPAPVGANHDDGHLHDWFLGPKENTGLLQQLVRNETAPTVCSTDLPDSTQEAAQRWEDAVGMPVFTYTSQCAGANVIVAESYYDELACSEHMCTFPTFPYLDGDYGLVVPIRIGVNPLLFDGSPYSDGDSHTNHDVTHELGHALGFADYEGCPEGDTLMDTTENCWHKTPQPLDIDNYDNAYSVDPVLSFSQGNPLPNHMVDFDWDASNLHNERAYRIEWRNNCTGQWEVTEDGDDIDRTQSTITLSGLQGGLQEFRIRALTNADPDQPVGDPVTTLANVVPSIGLNAPSGIASTLPSTSVNRLTWREVSGADHYKIRADRVPTGVDFPSCIDDIQATQYDHVLPIVEYSPLYYRVMACDAAGVCGPLSTFAFSDLFDAGPWDYVYTFYGSLDDIVLQFINRNPMNLDPLQLHILDGDSPMSAPVADSECIPHSTVSFVGPMLASSFTTAMLATQAHGAVNGECAPTHSGDSPTVRGGVLPTQAGYCCDELDVDDDGCTQERELGTDPVSGGLRDPFNPWDFFDTNGDLRVDLPNDILGVILRWTPNPSRPYDVAYDRGPSQGPHPWNMTAPDGTIDLPNDILGVILQWAHEC